MDLPSRKPNRMSGYDYSRAGAYFITIRIKDTPEMLSSIKDDSLVLSNLGKIIQQKWEELPKHYIHCVLDEYIIMPTHIHAIIFIIDQNTGQTYQSLSTIIKGFKSFVKWKVKRIYKAKFSWHKSFNDRILKDNIELIKARRYIKGNPGRWIKKHIGSKH